MRTIYDLDLPCAVYFLYGSHDVLLYVGISKQPDHRLKQHRETQPWAFLIESRYVEWFDTRREAMDVERRAIELDAPLFNIAMAQHDYQRWHDALVWMWNEGWGLRPWQLPALARLVGVEPRFWDVIARLYDYADQATLGPVECGDCLWQRVFRQQVRSMFGWEAENENTREPELYDIATAVVGAALPHSACDFHGGTEATFEDIATEAEFDLAAGI